MRSSRRFHTATRTATHCIKQTRFDRTQVDAHCNTHCNTLQQTDSVWIDSCGRLYQPRPMPPYYWFVTQFVRDMTQSYVWHVTPIHVCAATHSLVSHSLVICLVVRVPCLWHVSILCVTWHSHFSTRTHQFDDWCNSVICVTRLIMSHGVATVRNID